jgi:hypothetical protein
VSFRSVMVWPLRSFSRVKLLPGRLPRPLPCAKLSALYNIILLTYLHYKLIFSMWGRPPLTLFKSRAFGSTCHGQELQALAPARSQHSPTLAPVLRTNRPSKKRRTRHPKVTCKTWVTRPRRPQLSSVRSRCRRLVDRFALYPLSDAHYSVHDDVRYEQGRSGDVPLPPNAPFD